MKVCVLLANLRLTLLISSAKSCWSLCFEGLRLRTIRRSTLLSMKTRLERWRLYTLELGLDWMRFKLMFFEEIIFSIFWALLIINWSLEEKKFTESFTPRRSMEIWSLCWQRFCSGYLKLTQFFHDLMIFSSCLFLFWGCRS